MTLREYLREKIAATIRRQRYHALRWRVYDGRLRVAEDHLFLAIGENLELKRLRKRLAALKA